MKIRKGFVSNSSSASFIVGVAIIDDIVKFTNWIQINNIKVDYSILSKTTGTYNNEPNKRNDTVYMKSFLGTEASVNLSKSLLSLKKSEDKIAKALLAGADDPYIAWFNEYGNDPEWNEEREEYNYDDIDISWFDKNCYDLYNAFTKPNNETGILVGDVIYGGGRDG